MNRPIHKGTISDGKGHAICGATGKADTAAAKARYTDNPDAVTCINCRRVLDGATRKAERKAERAERERDQRVDWAIAAASKALGHVTELAKIIEDSRLGEAEDGLSAAIEALDELR